MYQFVTQALRRVLERRSTRALLTIATLAGMLVGPVSASHAQEYGGRYYDEGYQAPPPPPPPDYQRRYWENGSDRWREDRRDYRRMHRPYRHAPPWAHRRYHHHRHFD